MPTQVRSAQIKDGDISRSDINITVSGESLITRLFTRQGDYNNIIIVQSSGVDSGTGDVTIDIAPTLRLYNYITTRTEILNLINTNNTNNNTGSNSEQIISFKFRSLVNSNIFITSSVSSIRNNNDTTQLLFYNNTLNGYRLSTIIDENLNLITSGSLISRTGSLILIGNNNFSTSLRPISNLTSNRILFLPNENSTLLTELSDNKNINLTNIGGYFADGLNDYLFLTHSAELNFGTDDFSIEIIFSTLNNNTNRFLVGKGSGYSGSTNLGFALFISSSNKLAFMLRNSNNTANLIYTSSLTVQTNSIYNIIINKINNGINIYSNGILDSTYNFPDGTIINVNNNQNLNVFAYQTGSNISDYNYGRLLLLRLYNYALSTEEINILYNNFKIGNYKLNDLNPYTNNILIYNSDFSQDFGNFQKIDGSNLEYLSQFNNKNNVLKIYSDIDYLTKERAIIINDYQNLKYEVFKKYRIKYDYYISSDNGYIKKLMLFTTGSLNSEVTIDSNLDNWITVEKIQIFKYPNRRLKINLLDSNNNFNIYGNGESVYISSLSVMPIGCLLEFLPENAGSNGWLNSANLNLSLQTSGSIYSVFGYKDIKTYISSNEIILENTWKENYILKQILIINPTTNSNYYYIGTEPSNYNLYNGEQIIANSTQLLNLNLFSQINQNLYVKADFSFINLVLLYEKLN